MTKISFDFFGFALLEPMAFILNLAIAFQALLYFTKLKGLDQNEFVRYWRGFFLFFGVSAFFGGFSHLFFNYMGLAGKIPGWTIGLLAISSAELAMASLLDGKQRKFSQYFVFSKLVIIGFALAYDFTFNWVIIHSSIGFLAFVGIPSTVGIILGKTQLRFFAVAILALLMSLPIRLFEFDLHVWFNRDDIAHILMLTSSWLFLLGIRETESRKISVANQNANQ